MQIENEVMSSDDIEGFLEPTKDGTSSTPTSPQPSTSATASSSPLDPDDPDFIGPRPPKVAKKTHDADVSLNRDNWIRHLHFQSAGKTSNAEMFRFCAATLQAGGFDLESYAISEEWIRLKRIKLEKETAEAIKVTSARVYIK